MKNHTILPPTSVHMYNFPSPLMALHHARLSDSSRPPSQQSATRSLNRRSNTSSTTRSRPNLGRLLAIITRALVNPADTRILDARVLDGGFIAIVGIHAGHHLGALDPDVGKSRRTRVLRLAVAARPVQLADVGGVEVLDGHGPASVVLEHLVVGVARAAAVDVGGSRRLLEGGGVFADVGPPTVFGVVCLSAPVCSLADVCIESGHGMGGRKERKIKTELTHYSKCTSPYNARPPRYSGQSPRCSASLRLPG